eukprot:scaffold113009_cov35-Prasinocladus_malaysianus.AAC.1
MSLPSRAGLGDGRPTCRRACTSSSSESRAGSFRSLRIVSIRSASGLLKFGLLCGVLFAVMKPSRMSRKAGLPLVKQLRPWQTMCLV